MRGNRKKKKNVQNNKRQNQPEKKTKQKLLETGKNI